MQNIKIEQHGFTGALWFGGWLFTVGFLQLPLLQIILGVVLWPYYLGAHFSWLAG